MAKKFMFVCLGVFLLAVAFHLGAKSAQSSLAYQAKMFAVDDGVPYVMDEDGSIWYYNLSASTWVKRWVWFGDDPSAIQSSTWGAIKAEFAE